MKRDDMLDASMLEVAAEEPVASMTLIEEAVLLEENPDPQEDQVTALHTPVWLYKASEPEDAASPGVMTADPQNKWRWILPPPLGFAQPLAFYSGPPPLENADMPMGMPRGACLAGFDFPQLHADNHKQNMTGKLEYHYEARVISRMSLNINPPDLAPTGNSWTNKWVNQS